MRILDSNLTLKSEHKVVESYEKNETLNIWTDNPQSSGSNQSSLLLNLTGDEITDVISFSDRAKELIKMEHSVVQKQPDTEDSFELKLEEKDKRIVRLIERFIETLTGKKIKLNIPNIRLSQIKSEAPSITEEAALPQENRIGWGVTYSFHESIFEKESLTFSAAGKIKTQDGREFTLDFRLNMARTYSYQKNINIRLGDAAKIDPLVINFGNGPLTLTKEKYSFDLDSDGISDLISFTGVGSGFLALDLDNNGSIDNGSELFGPKSGDGFKDLAQYDEDNNLWIDENDSIFESLRIWAKNAQGEDYLLALGKVGIGAIYLGHLSSRFAFKDENNSLQGELQQSGIYLRENGSAGSIQHIDLAV